MSALRLRSTRLAGRTPRALNHGKRRAVDVTPTDGPGRSPG